MVSTEPESLSGETSAGYCNMCRNEISEWEWFGAGNTRARCPNCRSLDRHRHLGILLQRLMPVLAGSRVALEYGPNPLIREMLRAEFDARYIGLDISASSRRVDLVADACSLPMNRGSVDLAICFHVLEHIPDDITALHELRRVLGSRGVALIQSPWRRTAKTDEDPLAPPEERAERFGYKEHVRIYGHDIDDRLRECGFEVFRLEAADYLPDDLRHQYAIGDQSTIWVCRPIPVPDRPAVSAPTDRSPGRATQAKALVRTCEAAARRMLRRVRSLGSAFVRSPRATVRKVWRRLGPHRWSADHER